MANRIIQIGKNNEATSEKEEIYVDISRMAKQNTNGQYTISRSVNVRAVQNSLDNIFSWIPGERIINPEFGTRLHEYLYEGITGFTKEQVMNEIKGCVSMWEPRVQITQVIDTTTTDDEENNQIVLDIKYYIKGIPDKIYDKQYIFNRSN